MKLKEFDITLDIKKTNQVPYFEVVAGDFETNVLNIALTDGTPYSLDELSAEIVFAKPDRTTVVQDKSNGVVIEDNIIKCTLASNTIAVSGTVYAEVRVLQDTKVLTSPRFKFYVRKPILNDKTVASSNDFPMLVQAIEDAKEATQGAHDIADTVQQKLNDGDFVGPQGERGPKGDKGDPGEKGEKGEQGETGAPGTSLNLKVIRQYDTYEDLPATADIGYMCLVGLELHIYTENGWVNAGKLTGIDLDLYAHIDGGLFTDEYGVIIGESGLEALQNHIVDDDPHENLIFDGTEV